jgi:cell division control protein 24
VTDHTASHFDELKKGWEASKRVADRVNEALRRSENELAVVELGRRVEDWKNHDINGFGALLLQDSFFVIKNESEREYHVYLFEKIILCCKEIDKSSKKSSKSNSMISTKRQSTKRKPDLQLKGRIFINNVLEATPTLRNGEWALAFSFTNLTESHSQGNTCFK